MKTAAEILEWAYDAFQERDSGCWTITDYKTAERLALGQRVLEIVERESAEGQAGGRYIHMDTLLAEAKKGDG